MVNVVALVSLQRVLVRRDPTASRRMHITVRGLTPNELAQDWVLIALSSPQTNASPVLQHLQVPHRRLQPCQLPLLLPLR